MTAPMPIFDAEVARLTAERDRARESLDDVSGIWGEIFDERRRAHAKHGDTSMESYPPDSLDRLAILTEEVGEVAKEFNDARHAGRALDRAKLRKELVQTAAMAVAWADTLTVEPALAPTDPQQLADALAATRITEPDDADDTRAHAALPVPAPTDPPRSLTAHPKGHDCPACTGWPAPAPADLLEQPDPPYVIDRNAVVWAVVRDGGMATRADYAGIISIGIVRLEQDAGPLVPFWPVLHLQCSAEPAPQDGADPDNCRHCGSGPDPDGAHTCPCPYSDDACPNHPARASNKCGLCGDPARGFATIGDQRYCHGDDETLTCYMQAGRTSPAPQDGGT